MGTETPKEAHVLDEQELIDFLYVDKERTDSFISQLRSGTLRSVTKTTDTSEGSSLSVKGSIKVAQGEIKTSNESKANAAEEYDPYHSQLIQLLNDLDIPPSEALPDECIGKMMLIKSHIRIHDFESIKSVMPIMSKNLSAFGLPSDKATRNSLKLVADLLAQMSDSISLTLDVDGTTVNGTLKGDGLSITQSDISRTYGVRMPGTWYTLGILDTVEQKQQPQMVGAIEDVVDAMSDAMNQVFQQSRYKIIPILVFRVVDTH